MSFTLEQLRKAEENLGSNPAWAGIQSAAKATVLNHLHEVVASEMLYDELEKQAPAPEPTQAQAKGKASKSSTKRGRNRPAKSDADPAAVGLPDALTQSPAGSE